MGKLWKQLREYGDSDFYPYHMPGHKRQVNENLPYDIYKCDITEIDGFDNLHAPEGILQEIMEDAADLYGAKKTFYLVNGSTSGILSAISATVSLGGHILMARNCHKAAYHGVYLRQLRVTYLIPDLLDEISAFDVITPSQVERALEEHPDIEAVLIVSPTYEGRISDIKRIAEVVHQRNKILIVDEAHGAHLGLAEGLHPNSNQQGADLVIHSTHKTLPAPTQSALLHVNGDRVDLEKVKRFTSIYQTSSPSYLMMAGIENALEYVRECGKSQFSVFIDDYSKLMTRLSQCKNLTFLRYGEKYKFQDIGKLVIGTRKAGKSGQWLYDLLREKYHLQLEMAAQDYCLAMFTVADSKEAYDRMVAALVEIDHSLENCSESENSNELENCNESGNSNELENCNESENGNELENCCELEYEFLALQNDLVKKITVMPKMTIANAWENETEYLTSKEAVGAVSGAFVNLYPPGIPILAPGEVITQEIVDLIRGYIDSGLRVQGIQRVSDGFSMNCLK